MRKKSPALAERVGAVSVHAAFLPPLSMTTSSFPDSWHPPVNIFHCVDHLTVCVKLPGTEAGDVTTTVAEQSLIISGRRRMSEAATPASDQIQNTGSSLHPFERIFPLPVPVSAEGVVTEYRVGMFWIRIPVNAEKRRPAA